MEDNLQEDNSSVKKMCFIYGRLPAFIFYLLFCSLLSTKQTKPGRTWPY